MPHFVYDQTNIQREKAKMSGTESTIVRVNVGGRVFETHKETLLLAGPGSKFHQMLNNESSSNSTNSTTGNVNSTANGNPSLKFAINDSLSNSENSSTTSFARFNPDHPLSRNSSIIQSQPEKPEIFFDRDPKCFEHILFYLRTASLAGVRELTTVEKLKVESEFYGLGQGFHDLLKSKERILNMTMRSSGDYHHGNVKKDLDLKKTYIVKLQIQLDKVEDYVKWDIERNENIIRIAIGHRTQCSTHMRYQVSQFQLAPFLS